MDFVTMHIVVSQRYMRVKRKIFSKNSCVFTICLYVSRHKALSPDQRAMNFTVFVEGFIETIILHLVFFFNVFK